MRCGFTGRISELTRSATPPPTRASTKRSKSKPPSGGWSVATSTAEAPAWEASSAPPPTSVAAAMARPTITPICHVPPPIAATSASAMAMPTATPTAISTARRRRSTTVRPSVITAEMGAKKGSGWSSSSVATNQASAAAIDVCRIGRAAARMFSWRERSPAREASAALSRSSSRGGRRRSRRRGLIAGTSAARRSVAAPAARSPRAPWAPRGAGGGRACPRSARRGPLRASARTPNERASATKSGVCRSTPSRR